MTKFYIYPLVDGDITIAGPFTAELQRLGITLEEKREEIEKILFGLPDSNTALIIWTGNKWDEGLNWLRKHCTHRPRERVVLAGVNPPPRYRPPDLYSRWFYLSKGDYA